MKYPLTLAHGDAGEFFFAYKIASVLKWPCRMIDIDIGLDAQVEVLNEADRTSTGRFVAFQVKTREEVAQSYLYVSQEHLAYWREVSLPVFVVLVDLGTNEMYLHRVDLNVSYPKTDKGLVRIDFDLARDKFGAGSSKRIADAGLENARAVVEKALNAVRMTIKQILGAIEEQVDSPDPHHVIQLMHQRFTFREELATASGIVASMRVGQGEFDEVEREFQDALQEMRDFMQEWNMHIDWDDNGDVGRFIAEGR